MIQALFACIIGFTLPGISSQGDRVFYHDARSMALGGVSIVLESGSNPASMALIDERTILLSGIAALQNERRGLRVYDSYGNNIGIATIANNTSSYTNPGPCAFVFPIKFLRVGVQYVPMWDYNYYYREEHRDDFYQLVRTDELSWTGNIFTVSPMVSLQYRFVSIGVTQGFLFGEWLSERTVIIPDLPDTVYQDQGELTGSETKVGISIAPGINFRFAYTYSHEYEIDEGGTAYPSIHSVGLMYQPAGRVPTKFVGQIDYEMWEGIADKDILLYRIGVEHLILMKYNLRYGFCIYPDYTQPAVWTTNLTLGCGMKSGMYSFDIGYAYGKRDYQSSDFPLLDLSEDYKFSETAHHISVTAGIRF